MLIHTTTVIVWLTSGYGLEELENPADFLLDILNDSHSAICKFANSFYSVTTTIHIYSYPLTPHTYTALHRRTVRKHKPKETLNLIQEFQKSEESQVIEKCLKHANTESEPSARKRCSDSFHQSCRRMPSTIATFFWQVNISICDAI